MVNADTQHVFMLSDYLGKLANLLGEYIDFNKGNLSLDERNCLFDAEIELARLAGEMNIVGVNLVFQDIQGILTQLEKVTDGLKQAVKKAMAVQDALSIAAGLVTMGTAIISNDPKAIAQSAVNLGKSLKIKVLE
jgi:hypothetical protein